MLHHYCIKTVCTYIIISNESSLQQVIAKQTTTLNKNFNPSLICSCFGWHDTFNQHCKNDSHRSMKNITCKMSPFSNSKWDIKDTCFSSKRTFLVKSIRPLGSFATVTMFPCKIRNESTSYLVKFTTIYFTIPKPNQENLQ